MTDYPITLSIIVPVFNAESSLEACVSSVLNQEDAKSCELILVNDGSTDASGKVMENLALQYPGQIKTISKENKGPGDTRNVGIRKAQGKYIAFLDSDDTVEPHYLKELFHVIHVHQPDMIFIDYNRIYTRKKNFLEQVYPFKRLKRIDHVFKMDEHPSIISDVEVASWLRVVKRTLFERNPDLFFSEDLKGPEDLEASLKWYLYLERMYILDKKLYNYNIRPATLNFSANSVLQFSTVLERVYQFYVASGKFEQYCKELEFVCTKHILLSNLLRLQSSRRNGSIELFKELRKNMISHFPNFIHNTYLKSEPFYVRITLWLVQRMPWIFYVILKR